MQVPIYKVHSLQVSSLFHTMKVLHLINTTPAAQFNKSVHSLDSEGCKFFTALLSKWYYTSLQLKANTFLFFTIFIQSYHKQRYGVLVPSFLRRYVPKSLASYLPLY